MVADLHTRHFYIYYEQMPYSRQSLQSGLLTASVVAINLADESADTTSG